MKILAVETSCDDTGISILKTGNNGSFSAQGRPVSGWKILSNIVASQIKVHQKYGGVYPMMAKREHQRNLLPTFIKALKESKLMTSQIPNPKSQTNSKFQILNSILEREPELGGEIIPFLKKYRKPDIDLIAVTNGPGLEPCLWVGINFAKALSCLWDVPIISVNHIESHILVNYLKNKSIELPAIALVVSGGHTQLILMKKIGDYKILGETRDDAAGECFDKCAKILGLGYPGGPAIAKLASQHPTPNTKHPKLPRPMIATKDYDFSFSGLKTAVLYKDQKTKTKNQRYKREMAYDIQQAIIDVLIKKTMKAVKNFDARSLILGGGVSANQELRKQFKNKIEKESPDTEFLVPKPDLSTDNALMVAIAGYFKARQNKFPKWQDIEADANLRVE